MSDEVAFLLPASEVKRLLIKSLSIFAVAIIVLMIIHGEIGGYADIGLFLVLFHVGIYFYMIRYKYVYVSSNHIRGESLLGRNVTVLWEEDISLLNVSNYGHSGYNLRTKNLLNFIFIPKAIAESQHFQTTIVKFAPINHPLLTLKSNAPRIL